MRYLILAIVIVVLAVYFFGRSSTTTTPSASDRLKTDLTIVGHDIKDAAKDVAADAKPAFQNATQKGKELLHEGAQKIADHTATQPATVPQ